jgi:hypothetical protein
VITVWATINASFIKNAIPDWIGEQKRAGDATITNIKLY